MPPGGWLLLALPCRLFSPPSTVSQIGGWDSIGPSDLLRLARALFLKQCEPAFKNQEFLCKV